MTKLSITLAVASLTISLASAANAYGTEPSYTISEAVVTAPQTADAGDVCIPTISPLLATALALPPATISSGHTALACAES